MTILVMPTEACNFKCSYCFEPQVQRNGVGIPYDYEAIKESLLNLWNNPVYGGSDVSIHGGEPLLIGHKEFEKLCKLLYNLPYGNEGKTRGVSGVVTNGSLIDNEFIHIFKKWNTYVALSCDGSLELNTYRGPNPLDEEATNQYNTKLQKTIVKLRENNISMGIMCILHKGNASTVEQLKKLGGWMLWLKKHGITGGRMNPAYSDNHPELELSNGELYRAWLNIYNWNKKYDLNWNPLNEMEGNLLGKKVGCCVFTRCDMFNTRTISILPNGEIVNCDRTFSRGFYRRSVGKSDSGRYKGLEQTECKGCEYWDICAGACPMEGVGGDWRNKTRFCEAIKKTYAYIEKKLGGRKMESTPITSTYEHGDVGHGDSSHGDSSHGDSIHGDIPHGDMAHGDSSHGDMPEWRR